MTHLAIIGAGAAGIAGLQAAIKQGRADEITLVDSRRPAQGLAFGVSHRRYLCNTSTPVMSIDAEKPDDYSAWLRARGKDSGTDTFTPRIEFSAYLSDAYQRCLQQAAAAGIRVGHLNRNADSIRPEGGSGFTLRCGDETLTVDKVLLALGDTVPNIPEAYSHMREAETFFVTPFDARCEDFLSQGQARNVLILGTSLTAIDAAKACLDHGARAVMTSPSGRLPSVRSEFTPLSPAPMTREQFADLVAAPDSFAENILRWIDAYGRDCGIPLDAQVTHADGEGARLAEEVELAAEGKSLWQYFIGETQGHLNREMPWLAADVRKILFDQISQWPGGYMTAMPLANGRILAEACAQKQFAVCQLPERIEAHGSGWQVKWADGSTEEFSAVICAAGFSTPRLSLAGDELRIGTSSGGTTVQPASRLSMSTDLFGAQTPPIGVLGSLTSSFYPFANFMKSVADQAPAALEGLFSEQPD